MYQISNFKDSRDTPIRAIIDPTKALFHQGLPHRITVDTPWSVQSFFGRGRNQAFSRQPASNRYAK